MKVLNLQCGHLHGFEGWFGSEEDFQSQLARGLVECPLCADKTIVKMPSAPRLNFGGHRAPVDSALAPTNPVPPNTGEVSHGAELVATAGAFNQAGANHEQQAAFLKALRHVVANTEDVGDQFANQARAMHYGDAEPRSIRGQASRQDAFELLEEGIDVLALPMPAALKETLQ